MQSRMWLQVRFVLARTHLPTNTMEKLDFLQVSDGVGNPVDNLYNELKYENHDLALHSTAIFGYANIHF